MSVADWKVQEKLQRRRYITDAAEKLFFSRGYDNVTMDDIAKEVGLTKKSRYLYFTNQESLFFETRPARHQNTERAGQGIRKEK